MVNEVLVMAGKYTLRKSGDQFHFVLKAANGEVILNGERYTTRAGALNGIDSVRTNSPHESRYERKNASDGAAMFSLKASNGERIGSNETYSSASARDSGIASFKTNGPTAVLDDQA